MALKFEKVSPTYSTFNPYPSLPSVAPGDKKQFLCLNIVLHNKTGPLFLKFNRCEKSFSLIMKIANSVEVASLKLRALMPRTTTSAYVKVQ